MATSKGSGSPSGKEGFKARGHSPSGAPGHGGHHRSEPNQISVNPMADHMRNDNNISSAQSPMGTVGQ